MEMGVDINIAIMHVYDLYEIHMIVIMIMI